MERSEEPFIRIEDACDNKHATNNGTDNAVKGQKKWVYGKSGSSKSVYGFRGLVKNPLGRLLTVLSVALVIAGVVIVLTVGYEDVPAKERPYVRRVLLMASIPVVALLFTWFHIWLAIQMMFRPLKFVGIWQVGETGVGIGWQGVVPRKALKMAKTAFACARPHLMGPRTWLGRCDPIDMMNLTRQELLELLEGSIRTVAQKHFPGIHEKLPPDVVEELTHLAAEHVVETSPELWRKLTDILAAPDGLDNDAMVVDLFTAKKELLNSFFLSVGAKEFKFIEHCGAALGFFCGCVQLLAYTHLGPLGRAIFLPATGFFLGIFTNWLAILVCFWPCFPHEVRLFGRRLFTIQGLFLKRQHEAAELYSRMLTENFFNFAYIIQYLQTKPKLWESLKTVYLEHNVQVFQQTLGAMKHVAPVAIGRQKFAALQQDVTMEIVNRVGGAKDMHSILEQYVEETTDVHRDNTRSMQAMSPDEFENLLHPIFKEDEWILILLGGVLGALVGLGQIYFL
eukprot:TRINITY_DN11503_c1_g6_i1.p1 TRINITY_DN11503_c1_g6~~TRINITY_DN11503_c1_g6_i1.p1  ORF type:complete len:509 (-),score=94.51 TRINITY_DN11503_c1_g6_i1:29-1555(-)